MWGRFVICPSLFFRGHEKVANLLHGLFNRLPFPARDEQKQLSATRPLQECFSFNRAGNQSSSPLWPLIFRLSTPPYNAARWSDLIGEYVSGVIVGGVFRPLIETFTSLPIPTDTVPRRLQP